MRHLRENLSRQRTSHQARAAVDSQAEDRNRYDGLFHFTSNAYVVTDRYAKVLDANVAAARLLNLPEGFITGKPLMLYVAPPHRKQIVARLPSIGPGETVELDMNLLPRGSEPRVVHASISADMRPDPGCGNLNWLLRDVTDQLRTERDLRAGRDGLRTLATKLTQVQEQERRRIATEIHDHIGQSLAFCQLRLGMLRQSLGADELALVDEVRLLLAQVIQQTRSLTFELSPTVLYELGLGPAIEWLLDQRGHLGIEFRFESQGRERRLGHNVEITLFEAVREILSNVIKHSRATASTVRLTYADHEVAVEVQDIGVGFRPADGATWRPEHPSLGLLSVRERMEFLNGSIEINSTLGRGTRVRMVVPTGKAGGRPASTTTTKKESELENEPAKRSHRR